MDYKSYLETTASSELVKLIIEFGKKKDSKFYKWRKSHNKGFDIHSAASYIISTSGTWNDHYNNSIKRCIPDLKKLSDGSELKIIHSQYIDYSTYETRITQLYTINYSPKVYSEYVEK